MFYTHGIPAPHYTRLFLSSFTSRDNPTLVMKTHAREQISSFWRERGGEADLKWIGSGMDREQILSWILKWVMKRIKFRIKCNHNHNSCLEIAREDCDSRIIRRGLQKSGGNLNKLDEVKLKLVYANRSLRGG